jgi:DNA-binding NarL/FixJ family response regulator
MNPEASPASDTMTDPSIYKTFVVSSDQLLFEGLQVILSPVTSLTMVPGNGTVHNVIEKVQPQLVILDMESHHRASGWLQKVKATASLPKILLLAGLADMEGVRQLLEFDVDGIVLKVQPRAVLLAAVTELLHPARSPETVTGNGQGMPTAQCAAWSAALSLRERSIVHLVSQGLSNKEVAQRLNISDITVRHHLTSIFSKLGVSDRLKLTMKTRQEQYVSNLPAGPS